MEKSEAMTSTHLFAYIHIECSRNVLFKIRIFLIFYLIDIKFSLFCSQIFALSIELT